MKSIYTYYKERLIEISGKNRSLYLKNFNKKNGYDVGKILYEDKLKAEMFLKNLWEGKSTPFTLIGKETKEDILKANNFKNIIENIENLSDKDKQKKERQLREQSKKIIQSEIQNIKVFKREIEEIERETGRYELFLCYPFVYGSTKNYTFKAPLLMFPIIVDITNDSTVTLSLKTGENVQLNKALMLAIADSNKLNLEGMDMEFDVLKSKFQDIQSLLQYLRGFGIRLSYSQRKNVFPFKHYAEPTTSDDLEVKNICILSRCSLANSIYADYSALEKKFLSNDSINELLNTKTIKRKESKNSNLYLINNVDYAQQQVVKSVNDTGNMVIYGPPGTGKSQTIVNIISDALAKNKKVLVVSQKKAALEVIFNRLATLNDKAMFLTDAEKERRAFYSRCYTRHEYVQQKQINQLLTKEFEELKEQQDKEIENLKEISSTLTQETSFGISLQEMYYNSYKIGKNSQEHLIYQLMQKDPKLMALNYQQLQNALSLLQEKNKVEIYHNFVESKNKNPFIDQFKDDLSVHAISEAQAKLSKLSATRNALFDISKYKYSRQVLTYYNEIKTNKNVKPLVKMISKFEHPQTDRLLFTSKILFPMYPFAKHKMNNKEKDVKASLHQTIIAIDEYLEDYAFLKDILTHDGYLLATDGILNGNNNILKMLQNAINNYINFRDASAVLKNMSEEQKIVLNFAFKNSTTYSKYLLILNKLLPIRIYHEIVKIEDSNKEQLSKMVDFENIRSKIVNIKKQMNQVSKQIAELGFVEDYQKLFIKNTKDNKDYIYQISKKQNYWPIRKIMDVYGEYLFKLFPCWLLSPENVSTILPLKKDLFDLVLFDEASQVFIENTIPSIYRGAKIVVAGDAKQLRPTTTFMKRYMGANVDEDLDFSTQAALEVESLLDLAVSRYNSTNITYHYRSKTQELIDFSNKAFYEGKLQIAPNISNNIRQKPIERILTNGIWESGRNLAEAKKIVELTKTLLKTRKNNETIGIITFNAEQENCIEDLMDKQCAIDEEFRNLFLKEKNRVENGEDVSLFIKNLENIQGDERDIIIFSIGYSKNYLGKVNSLFGSLSMEGGENRLNVAITRAKQKIYVITSIEPEELKVETSKYLGPKLLRSYLTYARAVSDGNSEEVKTILDSFNENTLEAPKISTILPIEEQIANHLSKLGYKTKINLGNSGVKISVAVYDRKKDKYLLGIETDQTVIRSSSSVLERDVFRNEFLKSRGWKIFRVWSRDWWHNPKQVMTSIIKEIEKQIKILYSSNQNKQTKKK
ncbi:MAG: AAA family ATPase [Clostridia bacterium]|nr:AAA family ATPase [Clostridia bacterium]